MAFRALPSIEMLRQLLQFDPEAGTLLWLPRTRAAFPRMNALAHWNEKFANKPAFTAKDSDGYHVGWCMGQMLKAHRVIWALHYGEWPAAELDHINRNRADNRIANLRLSNRVANLQNTGLRTTNKSGYPGVHWHQAKGRWRAAIRSGGRKIHLGYFDDAASASRAYERARAALHTGSMSA